MKKMRIPRIVWLLVCLLFIPWIAMQFTHEVTWSLNDFLVMGILLIVCGFVLDFAHRKVTQKNLRVLSLIALLILFLCIWAELAVGIFNSPWAGS